MLSKRGAIFFGEKADCKFFEIICIFFLEMFANSFLICYTVFVMILHDKSLRSIAQRKIKMKTFQVLTDSTSDLVKTERDSLGIDYVSMSFLICDKEYEASLDWTELSASDYYGLMRKGNRAITSMITEEKFREKAKQYLDEGLDVLYISCSGKLSGSIGCGERVAKELAKAYPDRKILCLDSLRSLHGEGAIAMKAAEMANAGASVEEAHRLLSAERLKYQTYATVETLDWLRKAGRVKAGAAFFGEIMQVKPIIVGDAQGDNFAFKKVRGRKVSLRELASLVVERLEKPEEETLYIEHADAEEDAKYLAKLVSEQIDVKEIKISSIGPIVGATVGPGAIAVNFYGKEVEINK